MDNPILSPLPRVLDLAEGLIASHAASSHQKALLTQLLRSMDVVPMEKEVAFPFMELPLLVYAAVRGKEEEAYPLAAAATLLYRGVDILDDIADGDWPELWRGYRREEVNLAACTLVSCLPQIAISEMKINSEHRAMMLATVARGLLKMSSGQQRDIAMTGRVDVTREEVESSVVSKSGEEVALFCALAAQAAGADPSRVEAYASMGRYYGTAGQLSSDCHEVFEASESRDLIHGTRTFPVVLFLEKTSGSERERFLDLLNRAQGGESVGHQIREVLHSAGVLRWCAFLVEVYCERARRCLREAAPVEPAGSALLAIIDRNSFFRLTSSERR